jgi:hypothetical protein
MAMPDSPDHKVKREIDTPIPVWLKELIALMVLVISIATSYYSLKSDGRSTREGLDAFIQGQKDRDREAREVQVKLAADIARLTSEVSAVRQSQAIFEQRFLAIEKEQNSLKESLDINSMMDQRAREQLIRKGYM